MTGRRGLGKWTNGGVRFDATIVATLVVTAALTIGAFALVAMIRAELTQTVETAIVTRAQDLSQLARAGSLPARIPTSRGITAQVIDGDGRVYTSTGDIEGQGPITALEAAPGEVIIITLANLDDGDDDQEGGEGDEDGPYLTAITGIGDAAEWRVVVAGSLAAVDDTAAALVPLLIGGIPLLALVVAATTWRLAGRTLRPVRAMTAEADLITVTDLGRRIPLPAPEDEIRQLGETLNVMLARLERSVARQRRFVADASHELKSPVASLLTMAEVASQHPERISATRFADDVGIEARRLSLLVDDLLTLARNDEGDGFILEPVAFDLAKLVTEETAHLTGTEIEVNLERVTSSTVVADRRRITQVVRNLIDNAARHAHSRIWLEVGEVDGGVELVVADDGPGIPQTDRERVFERFVRLDDSRSRTQGGTGLGLAVSQAIVHAHGGIIEFIDESRFSGAVVRIRLEHRQPGPAPP